MLKWTKEECLEALDGLRILERAENFKKWNQVAPLIKCDIIEQLIEEYFDNSANFKHFKLHSDSTFKSNFTKDELIKYIHTVYHNWKITDWSCEIIRRNAENISIELEKQLKRIQELELKEKQWIETERDYRDELKELKSNPPLKFEELKKDMWVWDNVEKTYRNIYSCVYYNGGNYIRFKPYPFDGNWDYFEENRFYRREIK